MTRPLRSLALAASLTALLASASSAQVTTRIAFTTTFPFVAGSATLPAGTYSVAPMEDSLDVLEITGETTGASAFVEVQAAPEKAKPGTGEIVFQRYGDRYVLKTLWDEADGSGVIVRASHGEKRAAKSGATTTEQRVPSTKTSKD